MKMNTANVLLAIFFILFGIFILVLTPFQVTAVSSSFNGMVPQSFPRFVGWFTVVTGVCQLVDSLIRIVQKRDDEEMEKRDAKREGKVILIFALLVAYTALCDIIGFCFASIIFVCAFLALMGVKKWLHYVIAIVLCVVIFYCFRYMLYIHLPRANVWIF